MAFPPTSRLLHACTHILSLSPPPLSPTYIHTESECEKNERKMRMDRRHMSFRFGLPLPSNSY
jgi:hypothetical protein